MARRSSAPAHASLLTYASAHAARSRAAQRIKPACSPLSKHWTIFFLPDEQTHFLCLLILALLEIMPPQQDCLGCLISKFISRTFKIPHTHSNSMQLTKGMYCCLGISEIEMFFFSENCFNEAFSKGLMAQKRSPM